MIQELFGGSGLIASERKLSISPSIFEGTPSPSHSLSSSSSSPTSATAAVANSTTTSTLENLRCPRCDSSNTKFCYYNNYNLTQPRHFCKTCRRYWTKGGALRNVPIGGGCRKNKNTSSLSTSVAKSANSKLKSMVSEIGRSSFDHELSSTPIMWTSPHNNNSPLFTLLRACHTQNPNSTSNSLGVKEEATGCVVGSTQMITEPTLNVRTLGMENMMQVPSLGLCSPLWKNSQQHNTQQHQQSGFIVGEAQNVGLQEVFQRLRSSTNNYYPDNSSSSSVVLSNVGSATSTSASSILESLPVNGSELGYWNPTFSWSDLPTTNGAYP